MLTDTRLADVPSATDLGYALYEMETVKPWLNTVWAFTMVNNKNKIAVIMVYIFIASASSVKFG